MLNDTIKISKTELEKMNRRIAKLEALEAGGVDSWEWYGESLKEWGQENEINEIVDDFIVDVNDLLTDAEVDQPAGHNCGYSINIDEEELKEIFIRKCNLIAEVKGGDK